MGVHGLNPVIKKQNKDAYVNCSYEKFKGMTLAMDVSIFLHKYVHTDRYTWLSSLCAFFIKMKNVGIHLVCVFDGDNVPIEKHLERENRKVNSNKCKDRLQEVIELRNLIITLYMTNHENFNLSVQEKHQTQIIKTLKLNDELIDKIDLNDPEICIRELSTLIEKIENQVAKVDVNVVNKAKQLVDNLGIPHVTAYGEAEALCASLVIHGYADAVLSRDTDSLVYGAPIFINEFKEDTFTYTTLERVLDSLQLTYKEFVDFCIMCGCDYNANIPRVAAGKAYKYILEYGSIEKIEESLKLDTTCLRYKRCREIFVPYSKEYLDGINITKEKGINQGALQQLFLENNCNIKTGHILTVWKRCNKNNIEFEDDD